MCRHAGACPTGLLLGIVLRSALTGLVIDAILRLVPLPPGTWAVGRVLVDRLGIWNLAMVLSNEQEQKLTRLCRRLVDQSAARVIVPAQQPESGFWFGGGNMITGGDGALYVVGRYRNRGDSRLGTGAGERGLELAIFRSGDQGATFEKVASWTKADLNVGDTTVVSIEGSALLKSHRGVELFVSTEKDGVGYPAGFEDFLKEGTGVWSIDVLQADAVEGLKAAKVTPVYACSDPAWLHIKDPFVYVDHADTDYLLFCSHPFCWTSSNTGYLTRLPGESDFSGAVLDFFPRGVTWDVAMTRGTAVVDVPQVGAFSGQQVSLMFYDGGECVRNLEEHSAAVKRPRGYSCEELGGAAYFVDGHLAQTQRLSKYAPLFVSPTGTGCSRYVDVLKTPERWYVTWQQSQVDLSQPLVMNVVEVSEIEELLS